MPQWTRRTFGGLLTVNAVGLSKSLAAEDVLTQTTESGLKIIDLKVGTGAAVYPGQTVKVQYTGWLNDFDDLEGKFDSSYDRRRPLSFAAGTGKVIAGWDEAILTMQVGGKRRLVIPSDLGYGKRGAGGIIPPDATLYFEMELLSVTP
eukprot:CAMPEP_0185768754 /NCGR_PEP_ID=MMETSP1174-20130828/51907_1 /TAXON_ID=35687 /ORGANISM="Dictyocha speculum, Strain CCMP1381" /LENGTH=147 /DNA_ID=CAMNT_0028453585 /DNA_START=148 /DNA_END=594 /DNA_ORIENTATION=-